MTALKYLLALLLVGCSMKGEVTDRSEQEVYVSYSEGEIEWAFGRDRRHWPEWLVNKFGSGV